MGKRKRKEELCLSNLSKEVKSVPEGERREIRDWAAASFCEEETAESHPFAEEDEEEEAPAAGGDGDEAFRGEEKAPSCCWNPKIFCKRAGKKKVKKLRACAGECKHCRTASENLQTSVMCSGDDEERSRRDRSFASSPVGEAIILFESKFKTKS